jgi:phosphate transport system protein
MDNNSIGHHISEQFNKELEDIRNSVLTMGGMVEEQLELAIRAFTTNDIELAELVIKQDNPIDDMEIMLDRECMQIMALRQPTAFDLRLLIATLKVVNELERVGDLAEHIAKMAMLTSDVDHNRNGPYYEITHMADLVKGMIHEALDAYARMTVEHIPAITGKDENVDREYASILRQQITYMMEDPRNITRTLNVLWTVRSLERIGDHACNICEHLVYMIKGEDVRHISHAELEKKLRGE